MMNVSLLGSSVFLRILPFFMCYSRTYERAWIEATLQQRESILAAYVDDPVRFSARVRFVK